MPDRKSVKQPEGLSPDSDSATNVAQALSARRGEVVLDLRSLDSQIRALTDDYKVRISAMRANRRRTAAALAHIDALLRLEGIVLATSGDGERVTPGSPNLPEKKLTDTAFEVLDGHKKPLHYRELLAMVLKKGVHVQGKDPAAVLLSRIVKDPRFKRTQKRGTYALSNWRVRAGKRRSRKKRT